MSKTKIAVITGASRGLGLALAKEFTSRGWQVIGTGRSVAPADLPEGAHYRQFDASNAAACEMFWKQVHDEYPDVQLCLLNNAGGYVGGGLTETKAEDYEQQMRSGYFSSVYTTRAMALVYDKAKIINVVSSSALAAHKNNSAYGAAKAAQMHFFQALQHEFTPEQYQITNLYPNNIATQGPDSKAIDPADLAVFAREQAEDTTSLYIRDVTIYPRQKPRSNN